MYPQDPQTAKNAVIMGIFRGGGPCACPIWWWKKILLKFNVKKCTHGTPLFQISEYATGSDLHEAVAKFSPGETPRTPPLGEGSLLSYWLSCLYPNRKSLDPPLVCTHARRCSVVNFLSRYILLHGHDCSDVRRACAVYTDHQVHVFTMRMRRWGGGHFSIFGTENVSPMATNVVLVLGDVIRFVIC